MLKIPITYTDFDGDEVTEDVYFNLTKAELTEMELLSSGTLSDKLQAVAKKADPKEIMETFDWILGKAYGIRSADGKRFIKSAKAYAEFKETAAYSEIYMQLVTDAKAAANFINAVIPKDLADAVAKDPRVAGLVKK